jgi:cobalt-zinc-cadmium efflux system membrane fusion protein
MKSFTGSLLCAAAIGLSGCGKSPEKAASNGSTPVNQVADEGHTHDGWWCDEHGVPEAVCTRCNASLVADFKAKGDWCEKHDRPDSQCFICHPEKETELAAEYEARYGKKPPKPSDNGAEADHHENSEKT